MSQQWTEWMSWNTTEIRLNNEYHEMIFRMTEWYSDMTEWISWKTIELCLNKRQNECHEENNWMYLTKDKCERHKGLNKCIFIDTMLNKCESVCRVTFSRAWWRFRWRFIAAHSTNRSSALPTSGRPMEFSHQRNINTTLMNHVLSYQICILSFKIVMLISFNTHAKASPFPTKRHPTVTVIVLTPMPKRKNLTLASKH